MSLATHETASPHCYNHQHTNSASSSSSSATNFFATKNLFKLFTKKTSFNNKKIENNNPKRIPFIAYNTQINESNNNLILVEFILKRSSNTLDFGFTISGYCPCQVDKVEHDSIASKAGIQTGDLIIKINSNNVTRATIPSIVKMIKHSNDSVVLSIYRNALKFQNHQQFQKLIINQGDQASTGIINSTENDFFLSKSNDTTTTTTGVVAAATAANKRHIIDSNSNNATSNDKQMMSNLIINQQKKYKKFLKTTTPLESFKSDDFIYYAGGSGVSINSTNNKKKHKSSRKGDNKSSRRVNHRVKESMKKEEEKENDDHLNIEESIKDFLPSPIPYLPPLNKIKKRQHTTTATNTNLINTDNNNIKKSQLTDSDYKTQSSSTTDIGSSSNECRLINQQQKINNDFENDGDTENDDFDSDRMDACENLLNLEEKFIEKMQKGVQQYSRPLRHCMMINSNQHHLLFQNIEKILAISEYQLNQLISQDDSTLISMFSSIGKLYENKMRMSCEAFDIYLNGIDKAFQILDSLIKMHNFSKFIQDSKEDINMDLKKFLLLPLTYVESVWKCLNKIKNKTNRSNSDYIPINTVLYSLEIYVKKSKINLTKYSINDDGNEEEEDDEFENDSSPSSPSTTHSSFELTSDESNCNTGDYNNMSKLNSKCLIYSSKINYRSSSKQNKWEKISMILFKDSIVFTAKDFDENNFNLNESIDTIIQLKDVFKCDFDLDNNEFQLIYNNINTCYSINLKASSIEEKHTWKKLLTQRIQQTQK